MRSGQLVEVEPGVLRRATCKTSPIGDVMYMKVDELISRKCSGDYCSICPSFHECLSINEKVSSVSARYRLSGDKVKVYLQIFQDLTKPE